MAEPIGMLFECGLVRAQGTMYFIWMPGFPRGKGILGHAW